MSLLDMQAVIGILLLDTRCDLKTLCMNSTKSGKSAKLDLKRKLDSAATAGLQFLATRKGCVTLHCLLANAEILTFYG